MRKIVWVEYGIGGQITRIFKNQKQAFQLAADPKICFKDIATASIRHQVYERQKGQCLDCGREAPYEGNLFERMHLDEIVPRGQGGLVSLDNCQCLCPDCHLNGKHGSRKPQWSLQSE
jgi:hypothetical protein